MKFKFTIATKMGVLAIVLVVLTAGAVGMVAYTGNNVAESTLARDRSLMLTLLLVAGSVVLTFFLSRRLTRPLHEITRAVEACADGTFQCTLPVHNRDEIGILARTFESMMQERKQAEENLRRLASFPALNPNFIIEGNTTGAITYLNPAAERQFPGLREAGSGHTILQGWSEMIGKLENGNRKAITREVTIDDTVYEQHVSYVPDSNLIHIYALDITERKRLEKQLLQAQKMEAVGRLAGGVAHDFNNLLTVIMGYSEFLLEELDENNPQYAQAEEIHKAGGRAAALTRQLLAFSRRQVLQPQVLNLNDRVSEIDKMLRRLIGEDINLVTEMAPDLGHVNVDPGQVDQILMNLVVNARDAMPSGGTLTIETMNVELDASFNHSHVSVQSGPYALLAVSDTGIGMDAETQARVFEPFFTTKAPDQGTGLGLSTVYGIVKQSGGYIWVYSEPGKGATFKIYLPRVEKAITSDRQGPAPAGSSRGSETILLVEDEGKVRELVCRMLRHHGYTVLEARHGEEALERYKQYEGPIHLLVTDVIMPQMSGNELVKQLTSLNSEMKILYVSGYTDRAIEHNGVLEAGANLLLKPFTPRALTDRVREILDVPQPA